MDFLRLSFPKNKTFKVFRVVHGWLVALKAITREEPQMNRPYWCSHTPSLYSGAGVWSQWLLGQERMCFWKPKSVDQKQLENMKTTQRSKTNYFLQQIPKSEAIFSNYIISVQREINCLVLKFYGTESSVCIPFQTGPDLEDHHQPCHIRNPSFHF